MAIRKVRPVSVVFVLAAAAVVIPAPSLAAGGSKDCTGKGKVAVVQYTAPAYGGKVIVSNGPQPSDSWSRRVVVHSATYGYSNWAFASPKTQGSWTANPTKSGAAYYSASSQCTKGSLTSWSVKKTVVYGSKSCPSGENVLVEGNGHYRIILFFTKNGGEKHVQVGNTSGLLSLNTLDTGFRSIDGARVQVRAPSSASGETWLEGSQLKCSANETAGD